MSRSSASILIVDDESAFLDSVVRMLRIEGYVDYTPVDDSTRVPALLEDKTFEAALLDITMPGIDGLDLLKIIKERSPRTECIMITAHESVPLVIRAIKQGAYDYLIKPITPEQLAHALQRALEHKRLLDAHSRQEELERQVREAEQARKDLELAEAKKREQVLRQLEKAHRELRETQAQLVQSEKMAAMGELVAGLIHEINNPLGAICSTGETLGLAIDRIVETLDRDHPGVRQDNRDLGKALQAIEQCSSVITSGGARVSDIISRLRAFARLDEAEFKPIDIHQGIEDVLALLANRIPETIQIQRSFGELPLIPCYPRQLNQVFVNLLLNARQAIDGRGEIEIVTSVHDDRVQVDFRDTGSGIPAENLDRIFDPGFTTRGVGVGAGLGLAICYRIVVDEHQGELRVDSEQGRGTTVTVILPARLQRREERE